jgi:hypothetical protein
MSMIVPSRGAQPAVLRNRLISAGQPNRYNVQVYDGAPQYNDPVTAPKLWLVIQADGTWASTAQLSGAPGAWDTFTKVTIGGLDWLVAGDWRYPAGAYLIPVVDA